MSEQEYIPKVRIETDPPEKVARRKKRKLYPNRMLDALAEIFEDGKNSTEERLQAIKLSLETIPYKPKNPRKTDKEKALLKLIQKPETKENKEVKDVKDLLKKPELKKEETEASSE